MHTTCSLLVVHKLYRFSMLENGYEDTLVLLITWSLSSLGFSFWLVFNCSVQIVQAVVQSTFLEVLGIQSCLLLSNCVETWRDLVKRLPCECRNSVNNGSVNNRVSCPVCATLHAFSRLHAVCLIVSRSGQTLVLCSIFTCQC